MATFAYGGLSVTVYPDMRQFGPGVRKAALDVGRQASEQISSQMSKGFSGLGRALAPIAKGTANVLGVASAAAAAFGVSAFRSAARVGEMDASLRALAKANNQSYPEMQRTVAAIRHQGIEAGVAQQVVAQFSRNQLRLADSTKLARVAQDAAVISGRNSTEVLDDLIHGITTQNTLVLRNAGVNVQAGQAMANYAKQLGKSQTELTASERAQAVLNAVMAEGKNVAGAYAAAMQEPGKVLRSFPRLFDDIKVSVGTGLVQAFGPVILKSYELTKALSQALQPGGKLAPMFDAVGVAARKLAAPLIRVVDAATKWIKALPPSTVDKMTAAVRRFGPAGAIAGAGLAAFAGKNLLGNIPILGNALQGLNVPLDKLVSGFGALPLPAKIAAGAIGLMLAVSPELRSAVMELGKVLVQILGSALGDVASVLRALTPPTVTLAKVMGGALAVALRAVAAVLRVLGPAAGPIMVAFLGIATAVKVVNTAMAAARAIQAAYTAAQVAWVAITSSVKVAQVALTVAQWAMNAAWLAFPGTWIIAALVAVGVGFALLWTKSAAFRDFWIGCWRAIQTAIGAVWNWIKSNWPLLLTILTGPIGLAVAAIMRNWNTLRSVTQATWNAIRQVISSSIGAAAAAVSSAWNAVIRPAFNAVRAGADALGRSFQSMGRVVASAMAGLRNAVQAPLRFAAFQVINPFLRGANNLLGKIGLSIPLIPSFSHGGKLPGYGGGDRILAMLEAGEAVVPKHLTRRPDFAAWAHQQGIPGFQWGGLVNFGKGLVSNVGNSFAALGRMGKDKLIDPVMKLIQRGAFEIFKKGVAPLRKLIEPLANARVPPEFFRQVAGKLGLKMIDGLLKFIESKIAPEFGGGPGVAALAAEVIKRFPSLRVTSAMRPGDPGYHGKGWARDLGGPVGVMNAAGKWMTDVMTTQLLEGIHDPSLSVKNYKRVPPSFWGAGTWAGHADHIHMAAEPKGQGASFAIGPGSLRSIVDQVARGFGVPWIVNTAMSRLQVESGFNARAVNNWDINAQRGYPSTGIAQIIRPTFQAYCGPWCRTGPFLNGVSIDPRAQIYTMFRYSIARYGKNGLQAAWGGRQGYAKGGPITEPIFGMGLRTGTAYSFGERGPEWVTPLDQAGQAAPRITVNVYPQPGQSETEIAAAVSRRLGWAISTGRA